jgi:SAM-dependent methyltransferase
MKHENLSVATHNDHRPGDVHPDALERSTSYAKDVAFLSLTRVEGFASGMRVLDVGCGIGDLYAFLVNAGYKVHYTGIDASEELLAIARARYPTAIFEQRELLGNPLTERYDYIFCNGLDARTADGDAYLRAMVTAMYAQCDVALAFSMKSAHSRVAKPHLQQTADVAYEWPSRVFEHCKTMSEYVSLDHASDSAAFSVFIYRKNRGALQHFIAYVKPTAKYDRASRAVIDYCIELELWDELRAFLGTLEPGPAVSFFSGQTYDALGEFSPAETSFRAASMDVPDLPWPHVGLAYHYSRLKKVDQAIAAAGAAIEVAPIEEAAHECLVKVLIANGRIEDARAAAAAMPSGALGCYLRGSVAESPELALGELDRSLAIAPEYLPALVLKAEMLEKLERHEEALAIHAHIQTLAHSPLAKAS